MGPVLMRFTVLLDEHLLGGSSLELRLGRPSLSRCQTVPLQWGVGAISLLGEESRVHFPGNGRRGPQVDEQPCLAM